MCIGERERKRDRQRFWIHDYFRKMSNQEIWYDFNRDIESEREKVKESSNLKSIKNSFNKILEFRASRPFQLFPRVASVSAYVFKVRYIYAFNWQELLLLFTWREWTKNKNFSLIHKGITNTRPTAWSTLKLSLSRNNSVYFSLIIFACVSFHFISFVLALLVAVLPKKNWPRIFILLYYDWTLSLDDDDETKEDIS